MRMACRRVAARDADRHGGVYAVSQGEVQATDMRATERVAHTVHGGRVRRNALRLHARL
jgi:hypothetical protein